MIKRQDICFSDFKGSRFQADEIFAKTFPLMTSLLEKAIILEFNINNNLSFRQYVWTLSDGSTAGWFCRADHCVPVGRNIIPEHSLLAQKVGGIIEYWVDNKHSINDKTLIENKKFMFCLADTVKGIGGWEENYKEYCEKEGITPLDSDNYVTFALGSNGNSTFYNYKTKEVFVFLHDGYSPFDFTLVEGQPEYTIHRIDEANTFDQYVELLASQWLDIIK